MTSSTVANNQAGEGGVGGSGDYIGSDGDDGLGGGIYIPGTSTSSVFTPYGVEAISTKLQMKHTLLGDNTAVGDGNDCYGSIESLDYNLVEDTVSCSLLMDTDYTLTGQDPALAPLSDYGGETETHMLLPDSPAIDAGDTVCNKPDGSPLSTDQRGLARVVNGNCDIGAVEVQGYFTLTVVLAGEGSGQVTSVRVK